MVSQALPLSTAGTPLINDIEVIGQQAWACVMPAAASRDGFKRICDQIRTALLPLHRDVRDYAASTDMTPDDTFELLAGFYLFSEIDDYANALVIEDEDVPEYTGVSLLALIEAIMTNHHVRQMTANYLLPVGYRLGYDPEHHLVVVVQSQSG